jgi:hypothetical protein
VPPGDVPPVLRQFIVANTQHTRSLSLGVAAHTRSVPDVQANYAVDGDFSPFAMLRASHGHRQ